MYVCMYVCMYACMYICLLVLTVCQYYLHWAIGIPGVMLDSGELPYVKDAHKW